MEFMNGNNHIISYISIRNQKRIRCEDLTCISWHACKLHDTIQFQTYFILFYFMLMKNNSWKEGMFA